MTTQHDTESHIVELTHPQDESWYWAIGPRIPTGTVGGYPVRHREQATTMTEDEAWEVCGELEDDDTPPLAEGRAAQVVTA